MFKQLDRVERVLFTNGKFSITNVVNLATKRHSDNTKNSAVYEKPYNSNKYADYNKLSSLNINTSDYLVFSYNDYQNKIHEQVYTSYPHVTNLEEFFSNIYSLIHSDNLYGQNGEVLEGSKNIVLSTQELIGNKSLKAVPSTIEYEAGQTVRGVLLFVGRQECHINLDVNAIEAIVTTIRQLNLLDYSNQSLTQAMIYQLMGSGVGISQPRGNSGRTNSGFSQNQQAGSNFNPFNNSNNGFAARGSKNNSFDNNTNNNIFNDSDVPPETNDNNDNSLPPREPRKSSLDDIGNDIKQDNEEFNPTKGNDNDPLNFHNIIEESKEISLPSNFADSDDPGAINFDDEE
ncbi:hypothetical protein Bp8pS_223 [Bacillus phage vB_BpuM-BpSp]|nr:hypothetical protein Bp8pS_223 [Bacillus phage vB_BpuM-BpSp]